MSSIAELSRLKGRRAVITGAAGHIGRHLAEALAELGADLALVDMPDSSLSSVAEALAGQHGIHASAMTCDLSNESDRTSLIETLVSDLLPINILVNNAAYTGATGLSGWATQFGEQSIDTWRDALEVNLTAVFHLCQGLADSLRKGQGGSIVNVASIYGAMGPNYALYEGTDMGNPGAYAASKGGLIQLTRWLATTLAPDVRVNCISPGGVARGQSRDFVERYERLTPLGRMATEVDMKGAAAFFASDLSAYCTGQNLFVDGGWTVW